MRQYPHKPVVLFLTSYPSRPCGIATFSKDLITAIHEKFCNNYQIKVCALENSYDSNHAYPKEVTYRMNTTNPLDIIEMAKKIGSDENVKAVCLQHEFGLWGGQYGDLLLDLLPLIKKPTITVFHTVLPNPNEKQLSLLKVIDSYSSNLIVMTKSSSNLLVNHYGIRRSKVQVIPHGTHHVSWNGQSKLKKKYFYQDDLILSTFGLLGPNKNVETTMQALPDLIKFHPKTKFLILGQTHPELVKKEGETYRIYLQQLVDKLKLQDHVEFVHKYLSLQELLEYLKLTDIYIFSSKDPNQAVSGTFVYAMSCGCPVVSTPIPHALEELDKKSGIFFDFGDSRELAMALTLLLDNRKIRKDMALHAYQKTRTTRWENVAVRYNDLLAPLASPEHVIYQKPSINISQILNLTNEFGILQFAKITKPDKSSGYTIDDNARALIGMVMYYSHTKDASVLHQIDTYLSFIQFCQIDNGKFQNYVDIDKQFHKLNSYVNLEDSNGRAVWALGFIIANHDFLPDHLIANARTCLSKTSLWLSKTNSPRAIAFIIKGLSYYYRVTPSNQLKHLIAQLADKLTARFVATSGNEWVWFENSLTYANAVLPEALILAYDVTKKMLYRNIGMSTLNFLLSHTLVNGHLRVISNRGWLHRGRSKPKYHGEQPIDVTYTIQALHTFYRILGIKRHRTLAETAFSWFLGNNRLRQVMFDPITGGCYDGLEKDNVNLNEGAESSVCYLIARLTIESLKPVQEKPHGEKKDFRIKSSKTIFSMGSADFESRNS